MMMPLETYLEYLLGQTALKNYFLYLNKGGGEVCLRPHVIRIRLQTTDCPIEYLLKL